MFDLDLESDDLPSLEIYENIDFNGLNTTILVDSPSSEESNKSASLHASPQPSLFDNVLLSHSSDASLVKHSTITMRELLSELKLEILFEVFKKEKIDIQVLAEMSHAELSGLGISAFGDRHKLLKLASKMLIKGSSASLEQNILIDIDLKCKDPSKFLTCPHANCNRSFKTTVGLERHQKTTHSTNIKIYSVCPVCRKKVRFVDQHIDNCHKSEDGKYCEICRNYIKVDFKKHCGECRQCPFCWKEIPNKDQLRAHIASHSEDESLGPVQNSALDLSPSKEKASISEDAEKFVASSLTVLTSRKLPYGEVKDSSKKPFSHIEGVSSTSISSSGECFPSSSHLPTRSKEFLSPKTWNQKRLCYPGDTHDDSLAYLSEFEDDDLQDVTIQRRIVKDLLELKCREIDTMVNLEHYEDGALLKKFRESLITKIHGKNVSQEVQKNEGTKAKISNTVPQYCNSVKNDLLPAFHRAYSPFKASWLIDCSTEKETLFKGKERSFVSKTDPIFMTANILEDALLKYMTEDHLHGAKVQSVTSAAVSFMKFIEFELGTNFELYGPGPLENAKVFHSMVLDSIAGNGIWKCSDKSRKNYQNNKKVIEFYENPGKQKELLQKYKQYLLSDGRRDSLAEVMFFDAKDAAIPTASTYIRMSNFVMSETIMATGVRPVVLLDLPNGPFEDARPGKKLPFYLM